MGEQALTERKINPNAELTPTFWTEVELFRQRLVQMAELLHGLEEQGMKDELLVQMIPIIGQ